MWMSAFAYITGELGDDLVIGGPSVKLSLSLSEEVGPCTLSCILSVMSRRLSLVVVFNTLATKGLPSTVTEHRSQVEQ
jgi:hypothetical protein